jgi:hypothetical protein
MAKREADVESDTKRKCRGICMRLLERGMNIARMGLLLLLGRGRVLLRVLRMILLHTWIRARHIVSLMWKKPELTIKRLLHSIAKWQARCLFKVSSIHAP